MNYQLLMFSAVLISGLVENYASSEQCIEEAYAHCRNLLEYWHTTTIYFNLNLHELRIQNSPLMKLNTSVIFSHPQGLLIECNTHLVELDEDTFIPLVYTERIHVIYNSLIKEIPSKIFRKNMNLSFLNLSHNCLEFLPNDTFKPLQNLIVLDLSHNSVWKLQNSTFKLPKLQMLLLHHNLITDLNENLFVELTSLRHLDLSHNEIHIIHPKLFRAQGNLVNLSLEWNRITSLDSISLLPLKNLKCLKLGTNPLNVSMDFFVSLQKIEIITVTSTLSLKCNCDLKAVWDWSQRERLRLSGNMVCSMDGKQIAWSDIQNCNKRTPYNLLLLLCCAALMLAVLVVCIILLRRYLFKQTLHHIKSRETKTTSDEEFPYLQSANYITVLNIPTTVKCS